MGVVFSGVVLLLLGVGLISMWRSEWRDRGVYERNLAAFSQVTAPEFARGFAGAQVVLGFGLAVLSLLAIIFGPSVDRPETEPVVPFMVAKVAFPIAMAAIVASAFVTCSGWPRFLFPPHARDEVMPIKAWWLRKVQAKARS